jgi:hypothetical protein
MDRKLNVYVAHAKFLNIRAPLVQNLVAALSAAAIPVKVVTDMDPNELKPEDARQVTAQPIEDGPMAQFNALMKPMSIMQISNVLKHQHILQEIAGGADDDLVSVVVEDDALFVDGIAQQLTQALGLYPREKPGGVVMLGLPGPRKPDAAPALIDVLDVYKLLPGCDSYMMDPPTARAVLAEYAKIRFANNAQLTYALHKTKLPAKMLVPNIFMDGTKFGIFHSTVELNGRLIYNPNFIALSEAIRAGSADAEKIKALFDEAQHKGHVEYFYLKAKYETARGRYHYAKALYEFAHALCKNMGVPLTQGSEFMKDYMKIFRHLQVLPS